jgi:hypothetical protein
MELSFEVFDVFGLVSSMLTTLKAKMSETRTSVKVVMDPCTKKRLTLKNISADKSRILMILGTVSVLDPFPKKQLQTVKPNNTQCSILSITDYKDKLLFDMKCLFEVRSDDPLV